MSIASTIRHILDDLGRMEQVIDEFHSRYKAQFREALEQTEHGFERELADVFEPLKTAIAEVKETLTGWSETREEARDLILTFQIISAEPDAVSARLDLMADQTQAQVLARVKHGWSSLSTILNRIVQSVSTRLWMLVKRHLKLKEWSIKGQVSAGVSAGIGLTGGAEVELVFAG